MCKDYVGGSVWQNPYLKVYCPLNWVVTAGQVVEVVVVVNGTQPSGVGVDFGPEVMDVHHLTFVWNCLDIVFIVVTRLK